MLKVFLYLTPAGGYNPTGQSYKANLYLTLPDLKIGINFIIFLTKNILPGSVPDPIFYDITILFPRFLKILIPKRIKHRIISTHLYHQAINKITINP